MQYRPFVQNTPTPADTHRTHRNFAPGCKSCDARMDARSAQLVSQRLGSTARTMSQAYAR